MVVEVARLAREAGTLALVVDATAVHDLGASDAQELGYSMAAGAAYLRILTDAGIPLDDAAGLIEFRYAATDEQFPTIAKLRAARRLWARVLELSEAETREQRQHAVTSRPMMSKYDPWVNMLRTTVAAFAAGVGGADSVTVLPFDTALGVPDAFGRRIARNTSSLLISESHLARVADPAGGAYAVEKLTDDLAAAGWEELGRIEEAGGVEAALADGSLRGPDRGGRRPSRGRRRTPQAAAHRRQRVPAPRRVASRAGAAPARAGPPVRRQLRGAARRTGRAAGLPRDDGHHRRPHRSGHVRHQPVRRRRDRRRGAGPTDGVEQVLAAYAGQPVVCLAGTDPTYAEWGADLVAALREAGASWVVVAGKPGRATSGVDDACAMGVDALDFLTRTREKLS